VTVAAFVHHQDQAAFRVENLLADVVDPLQASGMDIFEVAEKVPVPRMNRRGLGTAGRQNAMNERGTKRERVR
jgi:hypothetical protein